MMLFQKGYFFRFILKNKFILLNLSLLILIFCVVLAKSNGEIKNEVEVYSPVYKIETEENVYTLTFSLSGKEDEKDISLLSSVLKGMDTKATFFVTTDWLENNSNLLKKLLNDEHNLGLKINNNKNLSSRDDALYYLATENDKFLELSTLYPTYVRIENDKSGKIPELLCAFGQIYVSSSVSWSGTSRDLKGGDIVSVSIINSDTPFEMAEFIGKYSTNNYKSLSLEELLKLKTENMESQNTEK